MSRSCSVGQKSGHASEVQQVKREEVQQVKREELKNGGGLATVQSPRQQP